MSREVDGLERDRQHRPHKSLTSPPRLPETLIALAELTQIWRTAQIRLQQQLTRAQFDTWARGTWLAADKAGSTVLCVRTPFQKELLEERFRDRIEAALASVTGQPCRVQIVVGTSS